MVCQKGIVVFVVCICSLSDGVLAQDACIKVNITADAQTILSSNFDPKVVASILPYRSQADCAAINTFIANSNSGKTLVDPKYTPLAKNAKPYDDLLFALVNDPLTIFSKYLGHYLDTKDKYYIVVIFIQIDDRVKFIEVYNSQHERSFNKARKKIKKPFRCALRVWALGNRYDKSIYTNRDDACDQGKWLGDESGNWNEEYYDDRTGLEGMLMKHTIPYAQRGLSCYPGAILDDINSIIESRDLVDIYSSLVLYIQNDNVYLARKLLDHCSEDDNFTVWIVVLTTRRNAEAMKALDNAFRDTFKVSMIDFVLKCKCQDVVFKQMLAAFIDQSYKPA